MRSAQYKKVGNTTEDNILFLEAQQRLQQADTKTLTQEEVLKDLGLTQTDLDQIEVTLEK